MTDPTDQTAPERRDQWLPKIRASRAELDAINVRRAAAGLRMSDYIRRQAIDGSIIERRPLADEMLIEQLIRIGNNLNQIAHRANRGTVRDSALQAQLNEPLAQIQHLLAGLLE